jgi:hypothetical protein
MDSRRQPFEVTKESHGLLEATQMEVVYTCNLSIVALSTQATILDLRGVTSECVDSVDGSTGEEGGLQKRAPGPAESVGNQLDWILERDTTHTADAVAMYRPRDRCCTDTEARLLHTDPLF